MTQFHALTVQFDLIRMGWEYPETYAVFELGALLRLIRIVYPDLSLNTTCEAEQLVGN